jgi:radical SAM superfamily enzyme YgiQ (UPF0313 family)
MLTKLLFPPQWSPTQPYLSLPSLTAFLRANKCDVEQADLNVTFYDDLLSRKSIREYYEKAYMKLQELESGQELSTEIHHKYAILSSSVLFGEYIINEVENAKNILRDRNAFYEIDELFRAFKILELGLKLASSAYYPSNLTFQSYEMSYSVRSSKAVLQAISDREQNIFIDYFKKNTLPKVHENNPGLVGISIINTSQLIPGLTLAKLIKEAAPDIHVNIGGSIFTRLVNELSSNQDLFSVFDSVIVHEGETALLGLIKHLEGKADIKDIPNLIYKEGSEIKVNKISPEGEDINALPTPVFDGFPLDKYLSPELIIPVLSSRGCYWGRCTFCDHSFGYSGRYRPRNVELLYNDISSLKAKHKTDFFTFQDEGLSPKLISALSDRIIKNNLGISWLADSRFESVLSPESFNKISEAGCKMLYLGLESANERVLGCMDKGIKMDNVIDICRYSTNAGIWNHLFLIFGFPTETQEEAKETMDFILQNNDVIRSVAFGSFQLTKHSKVYENPALFDVKNIMQEGGIDISLWYDYAVGSGMSKRETGEFIQQFYSELSARYRDFPIWGNLDREHLFLYISHYKVARNKAADLTEQIERARLKAKSASYTNNTGAGSKVYPSLGEGVFVGTFNFNLAEIIHNSMAGIKGGNSQRNLTNVLFDTNNNRVFTITGFAKDILVMSDGHQELSGIITELCKKYSMHYDEAEMKCVVFLDGLVEKKMVNLG